jgi:exopolysaccharide production protein ExoZ
MLAHFTLWACGPGDAYLLGTRLEIYSVPMFYLLSGITLHYTFATRLKMKYKDLKGFFLNRVKRIAPLFYLASILTIIISRKIPDPTTFFTNVTGLFSIYNWDTVIVYGGWSIGNELVFYATFPILLWLSLHSLPKYVCTLIALFLIYSYFAFFKLNNTKLFIDQWKTYINPLNQLFLFAAGTAISRLLKDLTLRASLTIPLILVGFLLFYLYPVSGDRIQLVTGAARIIFTFATILIIIGVFKSNFQLPELLHRGMILIANSSYGIYLLHPIIYRVLIKVCSIPLRYGYVISIPVISFASAILTVLISYKVYSRFQLKFLMAKKEKHQIVTLQELKVLEPV